MTTGGAPDGDGSDEGDVQPDAEADQFDTDASDGDPLGDDGLADDEAQNDESDALFSGTDTTVSETDATVSESDATVSESDATASESDATATATAGNRAATASSDDEATGQTAAGTASSTADRAASEPSTDQTASVNATEQAASETETDQATSETATDHAASGGETKGMDEKYCSTCGEIIKKAAEICPECGVRQSGPTSSAQEKDAGIAAVLSAVTGGWGGQIYNGEIGKGLGLLVLQFVNFLLMAVFIGFFTGLLVWVIGIYDAYNSAQKINRRERSP